MSTFLSNSNRSTAATFALAITAAAALTGCRVGPPYIKPTMPPPPEYKESSAAAYTNAPDGTWKPAQPGDAMLKGKWWEVFNEPELNALEEQVNINNQNIAQYFQNFLAARALVAEARSQLFPSLTGGASYNRSHSPGTLHNTVATGTTSGTGSGGTTTGVATSSSSTATILQLPFDVSWEPDLWGRVRNQVRADQYAAQVSAADLENERLTEQADLAEYYFELRGQDALQDLYNKTVEADRKALEYNRAQYQTGIANDEAVAQAEVTLRNAQETATGLATNRALYEHAIATLIGKPASSFSLPVRSMTYSAPPIPIGMPSQLLERRPDVAGAERTMAQANALIGVEKAAYYPTLSLTGSGGLESSHISDLFSAPAFFWAVGSSATETIFDAGLRRATVEQYTAQYNADVAAYRQTVLTAFQQVEDYLATVRVNSEQAVRQKDAVASAQRYYDDAVNRYQLGLDPYLNVVDAQNTLLTDKQTQVQLQIQQMTAAVELVQALGGGWDATQLPAAATITSGGAATKVKSTP
jgi:NodT family efflux transporter outer membrane factor (OMF) lipoprotein